MNRNFLNPFALCLVSTLSLTNFAAQANTQDAQVNIRNLDIAERERANISFDTGGGAYPLTISIPPIGPHTDLVDIPTGKYYSIKLTKGWRESYCYTSLEHNNRPLKLGHKTRGNNALGIKRQL